MENSGLLQRSPLLAHLPMGKLWPGIPVPTSNPNKARLCCSSAPSQTGLPSAVPKLPSRWGANAKWVTVSPSPSSSGTCRGPGGDLEGPEGTGSHWRPRGEGAQGRLLQTQASQLLRLERQPGPHLWPVRSPAAPRPHPLPLGVSGLTFPPWTTQRGDIGRRSRPARRAETGEPCAATVP